MKSAFGTMVATKYGEKVAQERMQFYMNAVCNAFNAKEASNMEIALLAIELAIRATDSAPPLLQSHTRQTFLHDLSKIWGLPADPEVEEKVNMLVHAMILRHPRA